MATPSSSNLISAITDETGSGALVFATSPTLSTPALGTPASGNLANCTFPTLNQNTTGQSATAVALTSGNKTISGNLEITGDLKLASTSELTVNGTFGTAGQLLQVNSGATGLEWATVSSSPWTTSGDDIYYNSGNVGIGTSDPATKLDVHNGNILLEHGYGLKGRRDSSDTTTGHNLISFNTETTTGEQQQTIDIGDRSSMPARINIRVFSSDSGFVAFRRQRTTGNALMVIKENGTVGIGNTNPGNYKLKVTGTVGITSHITIDGNVNLNQNTILKVHNVAGTTGQVFIKSDGTLEWADESGGGTWDESDATVKRSSYFN